jgi:GNAT superfamily N-acetyltransferase
MNRDEKHDLLYVADEAAGEVVGVALSRTEASWDELYTSQVVLLQILQPYQRQGIGRYLIAAVAAELKRRGTAHSCVGAALSGSAQIRGAAEREAARREAGRNLGEHRRR